MQQVYDPALEVLDGRRQATDGGGHMCCKSNEKNVSQYYCKTFYVERTECGNVLRGKVQQSICSSNEPQKSWELYILGALN